MFNHESTSNFLQGQEQWRFSPLWRPLKHMKGINSGNTMMADLMVIEFCIVNNQSSMIFSVFVNLSMKRPKVIDSVVAIFDSLMIVSAHFFLNQ